MGQPLKGVKYFDGGIFSKIYPVELNKEELPLLSQASKYDWAKVQPSIFGNIFENSLEKKERHKIGAHYTTVESRNYFVKKLHLNLW